MKTKEEIIEYVYDLNLQNLTEKTSFDRAYKQGIIDTIDELTELKLLIIPDVVKSSCGYFQGSLNTTSATKCNTCGMELHEH